MGPKKGKKKGRQDDDEQFSNQQKVLSKWAQALQQSNDKEQEPNAQQLYTKANKSIYQYDFSNQRALDLKKQEPPKPQKDKFADLTQQEKQQLKKLKQKAKADKEVKSQVKNEKLKQRKKQIQALKVIKQAQKQKQAQDSKKVQQQLQKQKKNQSNPWIIPLSLLAFLIVMFVLQYQKELFERLSKFKNDDIDYYEILQADQSITDKQLKNKYKKLVLKYHPDRNPNCTNCKQKFDKIMKAWEILGDAQKRKSYDQNSGYISQLKSASATLTPHNYHYLVQQSRSLWLIQVFDSTSQYSRYFAQFWQEMLTNYGDVIKFGRIDIWHQTDMNSYIPYNFQVFPSVYSLDNDKHTEICSLNFERPIDGLKKCIQQVYLKMSHNIVSQVPKNVTKGFSKKILVYLDEKLRANTRIKAYNKMYQDLFQYYYVSQQSTPKKATVFFNSKRYDFNFTQNSKKIFTSYSQFLQSFIIQKISTCAFIHQCQQKKCILILNSTKITQIQKQLPLNSKKGIDRPSIYLLTENHEQLYKKIRLIQQQQNHYQNFDIGLYEGGRIDFGYASQADMLNPQQGYRMDLQCKVETWKDKIYGLYHNIFGTSEQSQKQKQVF